MRTRARLLRQRRARDTGAADPGLFGGIEPQGPDARDGHRGGVPGRSRSRPSSGRCSSSASSSTRPWSSRSRRSCGLHHADAAGADAGNRGHGRDRSAASLSAFVVSPGCRHPHRRDLRAGLGRCRKRRAAAVDSPTRFDLVGQRWTGVLGVAILGTLLTSPRSPSAWSCVGFLARDERGDRLRGRHWPSSSRALGSSRACTCRFLACRRRRRRDRELPVVVADDRGRRAPDRRLGAGFRPALRAAGRGPRASRSGECRSLVAGSGRALTLALSYAAGVTLYRRTQASALAIRRRQPSAPSVSETPIG